MLLPLPAELVLAVAVAVAAPLPIPDGATCLDTGVVLAGVGGSDNATAAEDDMVAGCGAGAFRFIVLLLGSIDCLLLGCYVAAALH